MAQEDSNNDKKWRTKISLDRTFYNLFSCIDATSSDEPFVILDDDPEENSLPVNTGLKKKSSQLKKGGPVQDQGGL